MESILIGVLIILSLPLMVAHTVGQISQPFVYIKDKKEERRIKNLTHDGRMNEYTSCIDVTCEPTKWMRENNIDTKDCMEMTKKMCQKKYNISTPTPEELEKLENK